MTKLCLHSRHTKVFSETCRKHGGIRLQNVLPHFSSVLGLRLGFWHKPQTSLQFPKDSRFPLLLPWPFVSIMLHLYNMSILRIVAELLFCNYLCFAILSILLAETCALLCRILAAASRTLPCGSYTLWESSMWFNNWQYYYITLRTYNMNAVRLHKWLIYNWQYYYITLRTYNTNAVRLHKWLIYQLADLQIHRPVRKFFCH